MNRKDISNYLQEQWERAIERAIEEQPRAEQLPEWLDVAQGLLIKTGLKGGVGAPRLTVDTCHATRVCGGC
jgi:hypothetical protein